MKVVLIATDESIAGIGVRLLSSCLREQGVSTQIILMPTDSPDYRGFHWDELTALCHDADLIGLSCMTHGVSKAREIKNFLAKRMSVPIVVGGIHAMLDPESLMEDFNLVCCGEGEDVMVDLATRIRDQEPYDHIPGLWVKRNGTVIRNQAVPLRRDLNAYPFPDYDFNHQHVLRAFRLIPMEATPENIMPDGFVVLGSRGCPHNCTYCCNKSLKERFPWQRKVRHYSVDYLLGHLKEATNFFPGIKRFWIEDDTFFSKNLEEIRDFAQRYKNEIGKPFYILISPWTFHREKVDALIDAGMNAIIMGIQSGSERVNHCLYNRKIDNSRIMAIVEELHSYTHLLPYYDFIGMNPFESAEDLIETISFINRLPPPFVLFNNNLAFYPGTDLYQKAIAGGYDVRHRTRHSDPIVGYGILFRERRLRHKLLHFILLRMAGKVSKSTIGHIPRLMVNEKRCRFYLALDRRCRWLTDVGVTLWAGFVLVAVGAKKPFLSAVKRCVGAERYISLRRKIKDV